MPRIRIYRNRPTQPGYRWSFRKLDRNRLLFVGPVIFAWWR